MNIIFVSHCELDDASGGRVFALAEHLETLGVHALVLVPRNAEAINSPGMRSFRAADYTQAIGEPLVFADGQGPDLVCAWTPLDAVRHLTDTLARRYSVPYLVHLEDGRPLAFEKELRGPASPSSGTLPQAIVEQLVPSHRAHPERCLEFLAGAAGLTATVDALLEFKPVGVPGLVFWPGFDKDLAQAGSDDTIRTRLGLATSDVMLICADAVSGAEAVEIDSLVVAVAALRRLGRPVVLVNTGIDRSTVPYYNEGVAQGYIFDVGPCTRGEVARLLANADIAILPGRADDSSEYNFPQGLPELLVSSRPVVLMRPGIGRLLNDSVDSVLLDSGHALEIAAKLDPLVQDRTQRERIGNAGRAFALRELDWVKAADAFKDFCLEILERGAPKVASPCHEHTLVVTHDASDPLRPGRQIDWWVKLIAFYLPQFHPIPENDEWWGEGFTEWTNVRRAAPNYAGHYQPQIPTDLGYYDLRDPEVMQKQIELAKAHGIHGFCFYYYWFNGHRLLERPLDQFLAGDKPDFPFCLCWANENWTRRWDGSEDKILMEQEYAPGYSEQLIRDMIPAMKDPRYIRVDGAPLVLVYRADLLPDSMAATFQWRETCRREGIPAIHLAAVQSFGISDPRPYGFDAAVEFPPHTEITSSIPYGSYRGIAPNFRGLLEDYLEAARIQIDQPPAPFLRYRCVMPGWDNTPRRMNRAHLYVNSSPRAYEEWLRVMVEKTMTRSVAQEPLLFLNAWNEWGEGAYLEPDSRDGHARLEATRRGLCLGMADYYAHRGFPVTERMVERALSEQGVLESPSGSETS